MRKNRVGSRRGFTLIEVLVIFAILIVLVALLLPAMQAAREAARRMRCVNHLNQLGIAVHSYTSAHGAIPPTGWQRGAGPGNDFGMKARLLPFLEQVAVYNALNLAFRHDQAPNSTARTVEIQSFLCPSDTNVPVGTIPVNGLARQVGYTSYPNNIGLLAANVAGRDLDGPAYLAGASTGAGVDVPEDRDANPVTDADADNPVRAPLGPGDPIAFAAVIDGLASTAMFSEWARGRNSNAENGRHQVYSSMLPDPAPAGTSPALLYGSCVDGAGLVDTQKGRDWLDDDCGRGGGYSHVMTPNRNACVLRGGGPPNGLRPDGTLIGASSYHPDGVNVLFMDGSVRFVKESIHQQPWWAIATIAGQEFIDEEPSY